MEPNKGVSRLGMMQARLQQQLMVEKESRLLQMAARQEAERDSTIQRVTKSSASSLSSSLSSLSLGSSFSGGQGRVRKLFEDRRSTGYDKSYPLIPVQQRGGASKGAPPIGGGGSGEARGFGAGYGQQRSRSLVPPGQRTTRLSSTVSRQNNNNYENGTKTIGNNRSNNNSRSMTRNHSSNPNLLDVAGTPTGSNRSATTPSRTPGGSRTPSTRTPAANRPGPERRERAPPPPKSRLPPSPSPMPSPSPRAPQSRRSSFQPSIRGTPSLAPSPAPHTPRPPPPGMEQCPICQRNFNSDRIAKHRTICEKSKAKAKKRKVFDPVKMRNKGTEAENYVNRGLHLKDVKTPKKNWRKQHEDFIATVRAAKGVQGYVAPPLDTSDYVTCPHCGRKFNQAAGERHIPKCSDIKSNKPTPRRK